MPQARRCARRYSSLWIIPDSTASLHGLLHVFRGTGYCRDVVVLVTTSTSPKYVEYFKEREYDHYVLGTQRVDPKAALALMDDRYGVRTVLTDSGGSLNGALLDLGLVDEISLVVLPIIAAGTGHSAFEAVRGRPISVQSMGAEDLGNALWLRYRVLPP